MPKEFTLSSPDAIRGDQLTDEINNDSGNSITELDNDQLSFLGPVTVLIADGVVPDGEEDAVQDVVSAHVPTALYFEEDYDRAQAVSAEDNLRSIKQGLNRLDPEDLGYVLIGRSIAKANGASAAEIANIVDLQTARNYVMATAEWQALPSVAQDWFVLSLKAEAIRWQVLASIVR